jgi:hypothetical protein
MCHFLRALVVSRHLKDLQLTACEIARRRTCPALKKLVERLIVDSVNPVGTAIRKSP